MPPIPKRRSVASPRSAPKIPPLDVIAAVDGDKVIAELDIREAGDFCGESSLLEVNVIAVDADDARRPAPLHLLRVETGVAADVENAFARQVCRQRVGETPEFHARIIAEEVVGGGLDTLQS